MNPDSVFAQTDPSVEKSGVFEGRIIFGTNITKVDGDTYSGYHKVGIEAGAMVYVHPGAQFGISLELLYSQKGARGANVKESYSLGTYFDKYYLNLNYIALPVMLHFRQGKLDYEAGVSYSRLITSKEWAEADVPVIIDPVLNAFNTTDYEGIVGFSYRLSQRWYGNIRYQYSLSPIRTWGHVPVRYMQVSVNEYNSVAAIRITYLL